MGADPMPVSTGKAVMLVKASISLKVKKLFTIDCGLHHNDVTFFLNLAALGADDYSSSFQNLSDK